MKRAEKNQQTRRKILDSAIREFAHHGYQGGSLNVICQSGGISKGIIYHYFDSKDDLYLSCIEECFRSLTSYLSEHLSDRTDADANERILHYFDIRMEYFKQQPDFARLFCEAVIVPPLGLKQEIARRKSAFDEFNKQVLYRILRQQPLRPDFSEEEIIDTFRSYQDFLNARYQPDREGFVDLEQHEKDCKNALNIFLYGILERP